MRTLEDYRGLIADEIDNLHKCSAMNEGAESFDVRGRMYALAMELAPSARLGDLSAMTAWLQLQGHENIVDLAAGSGFLTHELMRRTAAEVVAVDPSFVMLGNIDARAKRILGSADCSESLGEVGTESVDAVTSFGGLHHVQDQRTMMREVSRMLLPGGQFTAADVCAGTSLSRHFDEIVAQKSLTGHQARWLSAERLRELAVGLPLRLDKSEVVHLNWAFASEVEMALFFKGLHAYDCPESEIAVDLQQTLGYREEGGRILLDWPMIFFRFLRE